MSAPDPAGEADDPPAAALDWPALLRLAALRLGVPPHRFWRLSLKEWRALTAAAPADAPLSRAAFETLAALHPDDAP